jgi:protein-S-isoprenylcysteine O-methyltransferase Ste14
MEGSSGNNCPHVKIPPPLIFLALLCIAGMLEYWIEFGLAAGYLGVRWALATAIMLLAAYLALHALVVIKKSGSFVDPQKPTTRLVADGPFKLTRNPMYLALVLLLLALSVGLPSIWFLLASVILVLLLNRLAIVPEERYLEQEFGDRYTDYQARVRRWI